jgi:ankyrin repeat protein
VLQNLNQAADQANVEDLEYLVNCGENIDERQSIVGQAPIHKAVLAKKDPEEKKKLLNTIFRNNADTNIIDSNGWTPLHHAAYNGDVLSVTALRDNRAEINAISNQFRTPLHMAANNNHVEIVRILLEAGADIEAKDEHGCTPLHIACKKGSQDCVELLLREGAKLTAVDERQWSPLHYASYNGHPRAVNFLMKWDADFDMLYGMKNSQNRTAFIISKNEAVKKAFNHLSKACKEGDLDMVRILIREGEDKNQLTHDYGNTPLHIAAREGHYLIVRYLLDIGASIQATNRKGMTARQYL